MMRQLGAVLVLLGCCTLGFGAALKLNKRETDLRELIKGLIRMKELLHAHLEPLPGMLRAASEGTKGRARIFFSRCAEGAFHREGSFPERWKEAADSAGLCLDPSDADELYTVASYLGRYDEESQTKMLEQTIQRLTQWQKEAAERRSSLGRVYGTLGVSGGALLVILLL